MSIRLYTQRKVASIPLLSCTPIRKRLLQRKCACGNHTLGGDCEECREKREASLQRSHVLSERGERGDGEVPPIVHEVLRSPGQPLDSESRTFFEPRFGHDFSEIRVHTDTKAAESAQTVNALAYTVGRDVVFGAGRYTPRTAEGSILLAHELAHVIQQDSPEVPAITSSSRPEGEAEEVAQSIQMRAKAVFPRIRKGPLLARHPDDGGQEQKADERAYLILQELHGAKAEREREVEALKVKGRNFVLYQKEVRTGGSSSWLANNPGNMDYTVDTVRWGAYEGKGLKWGIHRFAIFPTERVGLNAIKYFLRKHQSIEKRHRTIYAMMTMWAPGKEPPNDPETYAKNIGKVLKLPITALVKDMDDSQLEIFAKEIQINEGWKPGSIYNRDDPSLPEEVKKL